MCCRSQTASSRPVALLWRQPCDVACRFAVARTSRVGVAQWQTSDSSWRSRARILWTAPDAISGGFKGRYRDPVPQFGTAPSPRGSNLPLWMGDQLHTSDTVKHTSHCLGRTWRHDLYSLALRGLDKMRLSESPHYWAMCCLHKRTVTLASNNLCLLSASPGC